MAVDQEEWIRKGLKYLVFLIKQLQNPLIIGNNFGKVVAILVNIDNRLTDSFSFQAYFPISYFFDDFLVYKPNVVDVLNLLL